MKRLIESLSDDQLLARVRTGRMEFFEPLVDRHLEHIRLFIAYHSPFPEWVDPMARETFLFALDHVSALKPEMEFRGWLRAIALNFISAEIKQSTAAQSDPFKKRFFEEFLRKQGDPYAPCSEVDFMEDCLGQLPKPLADLFEFKYVLGKTPARIASRMNRSAASVHLLLFRLRQEIQHWVRMKTRGIRHVR